MTRYGVVLAALVLLGGLAFVGGSSASSPATTFCGLCGDDLEYQPEEDWQITVFVDRDVSPEVRSSSLRVQTYRNGSSRWVERVTVASETADVLAENETILREVVRKNRETRPTLVDDPDYSVRVVDDSIVLSYRVDDAMTPGFQNVLLFDRFHLEPHDNTHMRADTVTVRAPDGMTISNRPPGATLRNGSAIWSGDDGPPERTYVAFAPDGSNANLATALSIAREIGPLLVTNLFVTITMALSGLLGVVFGIHSVDPGLGIGRESEPLPLRTKIAFAGIPLGILGVFVTGGASLLVSVVCGMYVIADRARVQELRESRSLLIGLLLAMAGLVSTMVVGPAPVIVGGLLLGAAYLASPETGVSPRSITLVVLGGVGALLASLDQTAAEVVFLGVAVFGFAVPIGYGIAHFARTTDHSQRALLGYAVGAVAAFWLASTVGVTMVVGGLGLTDFAGWLVLTTLVYLTGAVILVRAPSSLGRTGLTGILAGLPVAIAIVGVTASTQLDVPAGAVMLTSGLCVCTLTFGLLGWVRESIPGTLVACLLFVLGLAVATWPVVPLSGMFAVIVLLGYVFLSLLTVLLGVPLYVLGWQANGSENDSPSGRSAAPASPHQQ